MKNRKFDDVLAEVGLTGNLIPYLDKMIGIPTLNYVMDTDERGDLPIYRFVYAVFAQILLNHSKLEPREFDEILKSIYGKGSDCKDNRERYARLGIDNPELTDDDRNLLVENREEIEQYEEMITAARRLFRREHWYNQDEEGQE